MSERDLFNITTVIRNLEQKSNKKEAIYFDLIVPSTDFKPVIKIHSGNSSDPYFSISNYFLTYGVLHEFMQLYNSLNRETFEFFCGKILDRNEVDIKTITKFIVKQNNMNNDHIEMFDYSTSDFFLDKETKFKKGGDMINLSACYNNRVTPEILNIFLLKKVYKDSIFIIKLPNIISTVSIDILRIICYIFKNVRIMKLVQDSFFKDSFHIVAREIDEERYESIKQEIKKEIIPAKNTKYVSRITNNVFDDRYIGFETGIKKFATELEILIATCLLHIAKLIKNSLETQDRDKTQWKYLDFYSEI